MVEACGKCRNLSAGLSSADNRNFRNLTFHLGPAVVVFCLFAYLIPLSYSASIPLRTKLKRSALASPADESAEDGFSDYGSKLQYDGYPIVVPKRAALILDRILKEIESAKESNQLINDWSPVAVNIYNNRAYKRELKPRTEMPGCNPTWKSRQLQRQNISRRGNNKDKLYFRCYFNAVSCYKRK